VKLPRTPENVNAQGAD